MSRQLRVEYPGALYHLYSRGNEKHPIFRSDEDRYYFLRVLDDAYGKFGFVLQTYCLMPNHYHLCATPTLGTLSRAMHLINTSYSVYFNKKHERCGHVFQGRYRSIIVETQCYAYELSRYIHLNPVRASIVTQPQDYPWSSFLDYLGSRRPPSWLDLSTVLGTNPMIWPENREAYQSYVLAGIGKDAPEGYIASKKSGILGSSDFVDDIRRRCFSKTPVLADREKPQLRFFCYRISLSALFELTSRVLGPQNRLLKSVAIFVSHRRAGYTLQEVAEFFNMSVSGVSNARRRIERELRQNGTLSRIILEISRNLESGSNLPSIIK